MNWLRWRWLTGSSFPSVSDEILLPVGLRNSLFMEAVIELVNAMADANRPATVTYHRTRECPLICLLRENFLEAVLCRIILKSWLGSGADEHKFRIGLTVAPLYRGLSHFVTHCYQAATAQLLLARTLQS